MCLRSSAVALITLLGMATGPSVARVGAQAPDPPAPAATELEPVPATGPASGAQMASAVAVNLFRIPGKTVLCGLGSVGAGALMVLTFGTQYRAAGAVLDEGCGGKWVIGPADLDRDVDGPTAIFTGKLSGRGPYAGSP
jgi:hypothetical protein